MDFTISEEVSAISASLIKFVRQEVEPLEQANKVLLASERTIFEPDGRYCAAVLALRRQVRMRSAELGFYNLFGAAELGGDAMGAVAAVTIQEALNAYCGPGRHLVQTVVLPSPFTNGLSPILRHLRPDVFADFREPLASGAKTMCFALSEPDAGSDVFAMKTRAVRDGDDWILTGVKQWITNSPYADYAMVFALTDEQSAGRRKGGITGFFLETSAPGFNVPAVIPTMGHLGGDTGIVTLDQVRVPDRQRLGDAGGGLPIAIGGVSTGRLSMAGSCIGLARWALEQAVSYAKLRVASGRPIAEHQAIQLMLAQCAMDIYAAKSMTQNCAWRVDQGGYAAKEISMVKAFATEMLNRVMDRCIQVHGGMGLTNELRLEEGYRWARLLRIPDGTTEIQLLRVARALLKGDTEL